MEIIHKKSDVENLNSILDKLLQLEKTKKHISWWKIILMVTGSIAALIVLITLCVMLYKNNFSFLSFSILKQMKRVIAFMKHLMIS